MESTREKENGTDYNTIHLDLSYIERNAHYSNVMFKVLKKEKIFFSLTNTGSEVSTLNSSSYF